MLKSKKTILGAILCAIMTVCLAVGIFSGISATNTVFAETGHDHNTWSVWGDDDGEKTTLPDSAGSYVLESDITLSATWTVPEGTTNLCLNGYVIKANCTEDNKFVVIKVGEGATLNLYDCDTTTSHNGYVDANGLWHLGEGEGTAKSLTGGIITGGNATGKNAEDKYGGGVYVTGTLNMFDGNIAGNTAENGGAGIYITGGTFEMNGGAISYNYASVNNAIGGGIYGDSSSITLNSGTINNNSANGGGGIYLSKTSSMEMNGGIITENKARGSQGGGIQAFFSGKFTMTAGSITNNQAVLGGGIFINNKDLNFSMSGGTISGNNVIKYKTFSPNGGGIYLYNFASATFGGSAQITGNTLGSENPTANNVYLPDGKTITLGTDENAPTTMKVGITLNAGTGKFTADGTADYSSNFFSDSESYGVCYNAKTAGEEYLELKNKVVFDEEYLWNGGTAITYGDPYSEEIPKIYFSDDEITDVTLTYDYYKKNTDNTWTKLAFTTKPTDAGSYKVKFEVPNSNETYCGSKEYEFDIAQKEVELDWTAPTNLVYDGDGKIPTVVAVVDTYILDDCVVTASLTTDGDNINAGRFTFTATGLSNPNYKLPESVEDVTSPEYEITKATIGSVGFADVTAPIAGETIPTTVSGIATSAQYIGTLDWSPSGSSSSFDYDTIYVATVTLTITDGNIGNYQFANNVTLQGITGWTKSSSSTDTKLVFTKTFEKTAHHHSLSQVDGKTPTCTENGYMEAYYCSLCEKYFTDCLGEDEIGDLTAYNAWKLNEGKISAHHTVSKVAGIDPTPNRSGYKEAWKCSECNKYFEDEDCTILIGDEETYNTWKTNDGYLPKLPSEGLSAGVIVAICIGSLLLLLIIIYLIGYFFLYRKGKLDEKKIKVIYKFLPKGKK